MADVINLITTDHRAMERLFDRLETDRSRRPELLKQVSAMLMAHARAEEEGVYPAIAREAGEEDDIEHSEDEHQEAESLLKVLERTDPDSSEFDVRLHEFIDAVKHHIEDEETEILPALRQSVSKKRLNELGKAFDDRRRQELSAHGFDEAGGPGSRGSAGGGAGSGARGSGARGSGARGSDRGGTGTSRS
jgi:hemerythrin superfamily protein